jgi:hypothetical protein
MEVEKFKIKDIAYGLVIPIIAAALIMIFPTVIGPAATGAFGSDSPIPQILTHGFALMVIFSIPLLLGLLWNKWAGGAAGFLMGTIYYCAYAGYNTAVAQGYNMYRDPSFIGNYIVGGILVGYIAGALNNKSQNFKRMIGAGLTAALTVGVFQYILNYTVSFGAWMTTSDPYYSFFITMLPMILVGVIGSIIAKVMTWYGMNPSAGQGHY